MKAWTEEAANPPPLSEPTVVLARAYRPLHDVRRVDGMTREEVCHQYYDKIIRIARRTFERIDPEETGMVPGDLIGHGVIGLLEAFERFEGIFGVDFETFAEYRIRGAMLDAMRSADPSTRRRRELARQIQNARLALQQQGHTDPSPDQLAEALQIDVESYWQLLDHLSPIQLVPLEEAAGIQEEAIAPQRLLAREARDSLRRAIEQLPERERKAILLYYGRDCSLAEIAILFDVTPSRVCQLLSVARGRLKAALTPQIDLVSLMQEGES